MRILKLVYCIILLIYIICPVIHSYQENENEEIRVNSWVDPHSFFYDRQTEQMLSLDDFIDEEVYFQYEINSTKNKKMFNTVEKEIHNCIQEQLFYKRFVNLLLSNVHLKKSGDLRTGVLNIEATISQIETLKTFEIGQISVKEIDAILSEIIKQPSNVIPFDTYSIFEEVIYSIHENKIFYATTLVVIIFFIILYKITWSLTKFIISITISIFVISYLMTLWHLQQEAEIKLTASQVKFPEMPITCQPHKMTLLERFLSTWSSHKECEEYFKAIMANPQLQVTPAAALAYLLTDVITKPMSVVAPAISNFVEESTVRLAYPLRWTMQILLIIGMCFAMIVLPIALFSNGFSVGFGPFFHFALTGRKRKAALECPRLEKIELIQKISLKDAQPEIKEIELCKEHNTCDKQKTIKDSNISFDKFIELYSSNTHEENSIILQTKDNEGSGDASRAIKYKSTSKTSGVTCKDCRDLME
ncbi:chloride channel CLIC-like protein 1 [Prorops nasuta]|uniref:chloride channel CLIC-like protein 1 n=1 Tax=Prorops nasuta TaxID=863751 RepID=UPI0034CF3B55